MKDLDKKTKDILLNIVKRIKRFQFESLEEISEDKYIIRNILCEVEPKMKDENISLSLIYNELKSFKNEFKSEMNEFKAEMNEFKAEMYEFKSEITKDVSILKSDVTSLKSNVTSLKSDVALILKCPTIKKEISELKNNKK